MSVRRPTVRHHCRGRLSRTAPLRLFLLLSGLCLVVASAAPVSAEQPPLPHSFNGDAHAAHIAEAARRFSIPQRWIRAVLRVESAGNARAVSSAGAMGLMQIMPTTWAALRARYRLGHDPFAPRDNILAGTAYLREMYDRYGSINAMLAAYNAGPGRYDKSRATGRALPAATRVYVAMLAPLLRGECVRQSEDQASVVRQGWRDAPIFARPSGRRIEADPPGRRQADRMFFPGGRAVPTP